MKLPIFRVVRFSLIAILLIGALLEIRNLNFGIATANAQVPDPTVPCADTRDPEFHSLRPYQASPCQTTMDPTAKFCGNDLIFHDTIKEEYPGKGTCIESGGKVTCTYDEPITRHLIIDLSGSTLPFMGNTEDVPNSQPPTGTSLSDVDKVNGYVSWYLNGVMNRAEDGSSETTDKNLVNFSGPLNKLLPGAILDAQRIKTIENVSSSQNHNQIVSCAKSDIPIIGNFLKIGSFTPIECYEGNGSGAKGVVLRLRSWNGDLSFWNNVINGLVNAIAKIFPPGMYDAIKNSLGDHWNSRTPPLPWSDENGDPFETEDLYTKAYYEWRGKTCVLIPIIEKVVCFENFFVPNMYGDFYPYVPLSSTEDLKGQIEIDTVSSATSPSVGGVTVTGVTFLHQIPSTLFYSHMQESSELASILQDTYVSSSEKGNKAGAPTNVGQPASCTTVDVRSNKGDKLFATQIEGDLNYNATFSCAFNPIPTCSGICIPNQKECYYAGGTPGTGTCFEGRYCCDIPGAIPPPTPIQSCTKDVYISLSTISSTPKVEDVWSRLVAGPQSIFKRIFPKTNTTGSVGQIIDIPGSTNITYTGLGISQQNTDLKIPHIGGISEYFLKGIQTALRPKGLGEPITFGAFGSGGYQGGINCNQGVPETSVPGLNKSEGQRIAEEWYGPGVGKSYFLECNNDVIQRANNNGVNPIFTLAIWIHESAASNYEATSPVEDFGIHGSSSAPPNNFSAQLDAFLGLPDYYSSCGTKDLNTFISMYWFGHCSPQNPEEQTKLAQYISDLQFIYSVMAPGVALPSWPK